MNFSVRGRKKHLGMPRIMKWKQVREPWKSVLFGWWTLAVGSWSRTRWGFMSNEVSSVVARSVPERSHFQPQCGFPAYSHLCSHWVKFSFLPGRRSTRVLVSERFWSWLLLGCTSVISQHAESGCSWPSVSQLCPCRAAGSSAYHASLCVTPHTWPRSSSWAGQRLSHGCLCCLCLTRLLKTAGLQCGDHVFVGKFAWSSL